jgi:tRNA modification GTPase
MAARNASATLHTPPGRGGIAVIVLSGPDRHDALEACFRPRTRHDDAPGGLQLGVFLDESGEMLDEIVVAHAADTIELNIHGGPVVARAALHRLQDVGVTIVSADPEADVFCPVHLTWNNPAIGRELLTALPGISSPRVAAAISQQWASGLSELAATNTPGADALRAAADRLGIMTRLLTPPTVVLAGVPNVGKSTLANALARRPVSIVHGLAGTTRDWVAAPILIAGWPLTPPGSSMSTPTTIRTVSTEHPSHELVIMPRGPIWSYYFRQRKRRRFPTGLAGKMCCVWSISATACRLIRLRMPTSPLTPARDSTHWGN